MLTTNRTTDTSPGSPRVDARCGKKPVPITEAIRKNGQLSSQLLS